MSFAQLFRFSGSDVNHFLNPKQPQKGKTVKNLLHGSFSLLNSTVGKQFWTREEQKSMLAAMPQRKRRDEKHSDGAPARKLGRPPVEHEREEFTIRLRADLVALVREEITKSRPMPTRNDMIEVLIEDGLIARGYQARMPWLPAAKDND
jgi:uncharacterized protein (DUF4415 family)